MIFNKKHQPKKVIDAKHIYSIETEKTPQRSKKFKEKELEEVSKLLPSGFYICKERKEQNGRYCKFIQYERIF